MGSGPPVAVGERTSKGGRHDLGAAAPFLTPTSSHQESAGISTSTPKLVDNIESGSTRLTETLSSCIACTAVAALSMRSQVFVSAGPSASMARRVCRASCSRLAKRYFILNPRMLFQSSFQCIEVFFNHSLHIRQRGLARLELFLPEDDAIALRDSLALFLWHASVTSTLGTLVC